MNLIEKCTCCNKPILTEEEMWVKEEVEEKTNVYHFSCYNYMMDKKQEVNE